MARGGIEVKMKNKYGFTLIEIMITVGIVGLLATMATLALRTAHKRALCKQAEGELQMISSAALRLAWDSSRWPNTALRTQPGSTEIWDISLASAGLADNDGSYDDWQGPYYRGTTMDPWGNPYFFDPDYRINGVDRVVVGSFGPNGVGQNVYDSDDIYVLLDD
jgi:prepilin-type N-terminal cleavage/methylation domain-containing protein